MLKKIRPTWMLESPYCLSAQDFKDKNIHAVFVDLDNTLLAWYDQEATAQMAEWIQNLQREGISVVVISNNTKERVGKAVSGLAPFVSGAKKPLSVGLKKAVALQEETDKEKMVLIGDQLLTDVVAGRLFGIRTIMVKPIVESDIIYTRINRKIEKFVLRKTKRDWRKKLD